MRVTVIGCGDAFGSAGRGNACFRLDLGGAILAVDFGCTALTGWRAGGFSPDEIDAVAISHLHGDHFGGLPFLLLARQYELASAKPLLIVGPPGTSDALGRAIQALFPGERRWRFEWRVEELPAGGSRDLGFARLGAVRAEHGPGMEALSLRVEARGRVFAYSGDTSWNDNLIDVARDADLFVVECSSAEAGIPGHVSWPVLRANLPRLRARRVAVTHMGVAMRARADEVANAGLLPLDDGQVIDI